MGSALARLSTVVGADARAWGMSPTATVLIAASPVVGALLLVATMHWNALYAWLVAENSLIESAQVAALVAATVLLAWVGVTLVRRQALLGTAYFSLAAAMLFVAGEEVSWGQNLGFEVSESLERKSFQGSSDLHTGRAHGPTVYAFILLAGYGTLMPLLALRLGQRRTSFIRLLVPPLALVPAFFIPFAYRVVRTVLDPIEHIPRYAFPIVRFAEWGELCLYFGIVVFAFLTWRVQIRSTRPQAPS